MGYPVVLNGRTYTAADFEGNSYVTGFPDALEDFVTQAGDTYESTSTSSAIVGTGSRTFTVAAGKPYQAGTPLRISSSADVAVFMDASVTSYSGTSLVVSVTGISGSGTLASWNINLGGGVNVLNSPVPLTQGGTGATNAAAARSALGVSGTGDSPSFANVTLTAQGDARFADADSSAYAAIQAPATITGQYTVTLPPAAPTANGQVLSFTTAGVATFENSSGAYSAFAKKTGAYAVVSGDQLYVTGSVAVTLTLPSSPSEGDTVVIKNSSTAVVTVDRNGSNIMSLAENGTINADGATQLIFANSTIGWDQL
ncbi:MAG: hypothetical protein CBD78_00055 [Candidatus Thioglobus sp. TMED218]|nr:MAG: hypothetical protein CBD78_00055 [Candidatus Thioglobus sp. TMED218]|tara:strand:- start:420 stop:1358 length:939 start_codon:yes stop_codon:yes gene_type:complete